MVPLKRERFYRNRSRTGRKSANWLGTIGEKWLDDIKKLTWYTYQMRRGIPKVCYEPPVLTSFDHQFWRSVDDDDPDPLRESVTSGCCWSPVADEDGGSILKRRSARLKCRANGVIEIILSSTWWSPATVVMMVIFVSFERTTLMKFLSGLSQ